MGGEEAMLYSEILGWNVNKCVWIREIWQHAYEVEQDVEEETELWGGSECVFYEWISCL